MPRAIVFHAGFHKTGTTTVQQVLRANRGAFKPYMAIRLKPQMKDLLHAARGFSTWRDGFSLIKAETRLAALLADLPKMPRRVLCLSAEELSGHMPGRKDVADYGAAPILAETYARVCASVFPDVPVSFYLSTRAPEPWLRSAWAEHVKSSSMTEDADAFMDRCRASADLDSIAAKIAEATGCAVTTARIEDTRETPAKPLLDLCGVPDDVQASLPAISAANARLPDAVLLELLAANRAYADRDARRAAKDAILKGLTG